MSWSKSTFAGLLAFTALDTEALEVPLSLGVVGSYFSYEEPGLMTEKGPFAGIEAEVRLNSEDSWSFRSKGLLLYGQLAYDGSLFNVDTGELRPIELTTEDWLIQIQGDGGYLLRVDSQSQWRFFAGLQFRQWRNEILGTGGYRRHTTAWTLPLGLEFQYSTGNYQFVWEIQTQFWLKAQNESFLSDARRDFPDLTLKQNSGQALAMQFEVNRRFEALHPFLRFQAHFWRVDDSEPAPFRGTTRFFEPQNQTDHFLMTFGLRF